MFSKLLSIIRNRVNPKKERPISEWFFVTFDDERVYVRAEPGNRAAWSQEFQWDKVIRVCFKAEDLLVSDGIYIFTSDRPESYVIPSEANGGDEFWQEILRRNLFDCELAIEAMTALEGLFVWPPESAPPAETN